MFDQAITDSQESVSETKIITPELLQNDDQICMLTREVEAVYNQQLFTMEIKHWWITIYSMYMVQMNELSIV